jgi:two-component system KDP operon response regulator KdpE
MHGRRILIIDDEADLTRLLRKSLSREGAQVFTAQDGETGLRAFYEHRPELVILDIMLPGMDGWQTLRRIRDFSDVPIVILSALREDADIVQGLDAGAADYVTKPFSMTVFLARIRTVLRQNAPASTERGLPSRYDDGWLAIDLNRRQVLKGGRSIHLSGTEYRFLACLVQSAGRVLSYSEILHEVWGRGYERGSKSVQIYMWRLRRKLEDDPQHPVYLVTERGRGYCFQPQQVARMVT